MITARKKLSLIMVTLLVTVFFTNLFGKKILSASTSVFEDSLINGWSDWSWNSQIDLNWGRIAFAPNAWGALYLHNDTETLKSSVTNLVFSLSPSTSVGEFKILFYDENSQPHATALQLSQYGGQPEANTWKQYTIPSVSIPTEKIKGFAIQEASGQSQGVIYLDNIYWQTTSSTHIAPTPTVVVAATAVTARSTTPALQPNTSDSNEVVFSSGLRNEWQDWSWGAINTIRNEHIEHSPQSAWSGLFLHRDQSVNTQNLDSIGFRIRGTAQQQKFSVALFDTNGAIAGFIPLDELQENQWKNFEIPMTQINPSRKPVKGIVIHDLTGVVQKPIHVKDIRFNAELSVPVQTPTPTPASITENNTVGGVYTTGNNNIYKNGSKINLKGVNWFGFETDAYVAHGLWTRGYKEMISQIKSSGFNAVRVPFCPGTLQGRSVTAIDYDANPEFENLNSLQIMDLVLREMDSQKIYILLDHHRPDCMAISELWHVGGYTERQWIDDLKLVATRYKNLEYFMGVDLKNEPHGAATWGSGDVNTDWAIAAEKAGSEILRANENILVFVEGIGWSNSCASQIAPFWGENLEGMRCKTLNLPKDKLVFSPHIYGPDVNHQSYFSESSFPANMPAIWNQHWGFLVDLGYTIVPGEWGGKFGTNGGDPKDTVLQTAFMNYLSSKRICNSFYWSWNPNSGDTGGILQDDWKTVWSHKLESLNSYYNSCS
jgi:endoglucanase